jgi:gamma-glutamyltranspeptidase/glutathione hydrolase
MVASDEPLASAAGVEILKKGGNAVDAAVAVGFALAVVEPAAGNIGGGGFLLVRLANGHTAFVDYREMAPGRASRDMYIRPDGALDAEAATIGYRAAAVPGTVAGLELALRSYGTMKLAQAMGPAIRLADQGFAVSEKLAEAFSSDRKLLERFPVSRRIFLKDGAMYKPGEILRQPELAVTLRRIARHGSAEFYRGKTAQLLSTEMGRSGGLITRRDLARYKPKLREPLRAAYKTGSDAWEVISSPPPSSGGVAMIEALNILNDVPLKSWDDAQSVHWTVETMRRIFADRAAYLADPDFAQVPVRGLIDPRYAAALRAQIDPHRASTSQTVRAGNPAAFDQPASGNGLAHNGASPQIAVNFSEGENTTHFSVVDGAGNAVANTFTLNGGFGSGVTCAAGFLLNNEMDDFTTQPGVPNKLFGLIQSEANAIAPGKRPLSSMTPTIVLRNGKLSFVTGSPGGPTIISVTLLSVLNWMRLGMDAQAAINAPRFHHQWLPDTIRVEEAFPSSTAQALEARGHKIARRPRIGLVNAIGIDPRTGERLGAADPRDQGAAEGY